MLQMVLVSICGYYYEIFVHQLTNNVVIELDIPASELYFI